MTRFLIHKQTKTIVDADDGRILHFSYDDFLDRIVRGHDCFICGAEPSSKPFNNEHVIPNWILKSYGTPTSFMILPNATTIKNSHYTVPCCQECNTLLGQELEIPISQLLKKDYRTVAGILQSDERWYLRLFHWVCLLFFKTHLKDTYLEAERDRRLASGKIGNSYCWHPLYHIHNIIRQHHTGARLTRDVQGTIVVFEALVEAETEEFDYLDNLNSHVVMVKIGKIVSLAVLNDSRFCLAGYKTFLSKINGALNSVQIRELFARLRYLNENIKRRPKYYSLFKNNIYEIAARVPNKVEFLQGARQKANLFKIMRFYIEDLMPPDLPDRKQLVKDIEEGRAQYIFDEHLNFFQHPSYSQQMAALEQELK